MRGLFLELGNAVVVVFYVYVVRLREQTTRNSESLYLGPFLVSLLGALQGNDVRVLRSGIIQPVQRVAYILSVAVACAFLTTELFKGFVMC